jgi:hypothetical protein
MSRSSVGRVSGAGSRLVGGTSTIRATGRYLQRQLWAWPFVAAVVFGGAGWWVHRSVVEICMKHAREAPVPPSVWTTTPVSPDLEKLLLRCLAKAPADRPSHAAALLRELDKCSVDVTWTAADAAAWWDARAVAGAVAAAGAAPQAPDAALLPAESETTLAYSEGRNA